MYDIFVRGIALPVKVKGVTTIDKDGNYNVYINNRLSDITQKKTIKHEINHIQLNHFEDFNPVIHNELEANAG
jgi:putative component of toxin-antitoxin plasmid stabilization module